ncbi:hypothetical protein TOPH_07399 [Tolypocladium ophioglossoides CBS 100239]|uniref:Cyclin-dependent kinase n=1 Tax=Tolypocladium ophioglossoides (strain CBS 100239) TaxID=1163406 RepID=A0A0L0N1R5_TOLOC|nr:hypothetical protein TOPH_07399 [Tolypocladium ophioglossoides CBS 100239]
MDTRTSVSPTKRRAALAPLDANAMPVSPPKLGVKDAAAKSVVSPVKETETGMKRRAEGEADRDASPTAKKTCLERGHDAQRQRPSRSHSPDSVSVFDTSAGDGDASWATAATEPDVVAAVVRPARGSMTREQAREKAEILRLRLGLASYKLRTGQTAVPLADLQPRPLPPAPGPCRTVRVQSPSSPPPEPHQLKPHDSAAAAVPSRTPPRAGQGKGLTNSALRGGAASGLLSLARGQQAS